MGPDGVFKVAGFFRYENASTETVSIFNCSCSTLCAFKTEFPIVVPPGEVRCFPIRFGARDVVDGEIQLTFLTDASEPMCHIWILRPTQDSWADVEQLISVPIPDPMFSGQTLHED